MTEVRRVAWPHYEKPEWSERQFLQGIAGTLELFHLSTVRFQNIVGEATGHPVVVYQRIDQAGQRLPIDDEVLGDTDTMMVFGLDHMVTEQEAGTGGNRSGPKISDARGNLSHHRSASRCRGIQRSGGASNGIRAPRRSLGSRQQRFGLYTRSLMKGLGVPVENRCGSAPGAVAGDEPDCAVDGLRDWTTPGMAYRRDNIQFPPTPAALRLTTDDTKSIRVLARQPIDMSRSPPVYGSGKQRIQCIPVDAAKRDAGWRYFVGRPDDFYNPVRRNR